MGERRLGPASPFSRLSWLTAEFREPAFNCGLSITPLLMRPRNPPHSLPSGLEEHSQSYQQLHLTS